MANKCSICGKNMVSGRKHQPTGELICDSQNCWSEWFINNTNQWGRM